MLGSFLANAQKLSLFCETGEPSGVGPVLYLDMIGHGTILELNLELNINSVDPENRKPNISIKRQLIINRSDIKNNMIIPLSRAYQVRVSRLKSGNSLYWQALVESTAIKFIPIELSCQ